MFLLFARRGNQKLPVRVEQAGKAPRESSDNLVSMESCRADQTDLMDTTIMRGYRATFTLLVGKDRGSGNIRRTGTL